MLKVSMIFLALVILTLATACGPQPQPMRQAQNIDAALSPYLDKFLSSASDNGMTLNTSSLSMTFSETMPPSSIPNSQVLAYCQRSSYGQSVVVWTAYWNQTSVSNREQLIFHELGHCLLGLSHDDTTQPAFDYYGTPSYMPNAPRSIMNTFHFGAGLYSGNRDAYLKQLFNPASSMPLYWNAPSQIGPDEYEF